MNDERSKTKNSALKFYRDQKKLLDLVRDRSPNLGFELAIGRVFGDNPSNGKLVRIGRQELSYSSHTKSLVSFLPVSWRKEFDAMGEPWSGCENWWAGYPLIAWIEIRAGDDGAAGQLRLNAEVGPVSVHEARKTIISTIKSAASANKLDRIQFPIGSTKERRLYSRFLTRNAIAVNDIHSADDIEDKLVRLVADFAPEFDLVAHVIPQFIDFSAQSSRNR